MIFSLQGHFKRTELNEFKQYNFCDFKRFLSSSVLEFIGKVPWKSWISSSIEGRNPETRIFSHYYSKIEIEISPCLVYYDFVPIIINNYWMRSSRIWGIIKAEVCVICRSRRLRQITQTEALIIPHILREPNSITVLLFICICKLFPWRSRPFVFSRIWHKQHKLLWRHNVV